MEKKPRSDRKEDKKNSGPLWADLHAESHCVISDEHLICGDEATAPIRLSPIEDDEFVSVHPLENLEKIVAALPAVQEPHQPAVLPPVKKVDVQYIFLGMAVMAIMGIGVWSWIFVKHHKRDAVSFREFQVQLAGQTVMDSSPVLLPSKIIQKKMALHVDVNKKLQETNRHINLGKQALKERYMSKAIDNFMRARLILSSFSHSKADFLHGELNALHANALYWQGFLAMEKEDQCRAKTYFTQAHEMAPHDKKILDRLNEISASLRC